MRMLKHYLIMPANKWTARINWQVRKSKYTKRSSKIAKALGNNIDGTPVSLSLYDQRYQRQAMANGCVRVYSGLMDLMTDNEIEGVLGHELGHVL